MERSNLPRTLGLLSGIGLWTFLLLALGSFSSSDWPSHQVYPYPAIQNLCGAVGAYIAYWSYLAIGQGVFPILFFTGVCIALYLFRGRVGDLWLRAIGLLLLSIAFSALIHNFRPGTPDSFPEGQGGIIGIGTSAFLQDHFSTIGTRLVLVLALLVGLLLTADDLVLRAPAAVSSAIYNVREHMPTPALKFNFRMPELPTLPSLPFFRTRDGVAMASAGGPVQRLRAEVDDERGTVLLSDIPEDVEPLDEVELEYPEDQLIAEDSAHADDAEPPPSEAIVVPPPEQSAVVASTTSAAAAPAVDAALRENAAEPAPASSGANPLTESRVGEAPPPPKNDIVVRGPNQIKPRQQSPAMAQAPKELGEYHLPGWEILAEAEHGFAESQEKYVREKAAVLEQALREFSIDARVTEIDTGPVITMYELSLAPGIKVSAITALANDIARALAATSVRIVAPVPGKHTVGIEVPNAEKEKVRLKELMQLAPDATRKMTIPLYLGKDASGEPLITDLTAMPHCLIAGTTGSGKSVCINTIIMSVMYTQRPDYVKLLLVDPKVVEMAPFKDIPHLMAPVINDAGRACSVLEWACEKMDERYELLAEAGVRNIKGYNSLTREELIEKFCPGSPEEEAKIPKHLPYWIIIIDELADLMMTSGKEVESSIVRLAQKSRAVGIHLIVATQRPSANVVTGLIKSNLPSRIAFRVQSRMDSRIVLDQNGADLLLGQGDMLFMPPGASKPIRSQGTFIDDKEIRESVKLVKGLAEAQYEPELVQIKSKVGDGGEFEKDELFDDAVRVVLETKRGSVSLLQRRLTIGYSRASRLIEQMAAMGIVGDYKGSQAREATLSVEEWDAMKAQEAADRESGMTV